MLATVFKHVCMLSKQYLVTSFANCLQYFDNVGWALRRHPCL